jgi:hypothetical protein
LKKKQKKRRQFFFVFILKSKYKTIDFLTNKKNTDTGIRLKIKTIQYNTNTCLVSVAPLVQVPHLLEGLPSSRPRVSFGIPGYPPKFLGKRHIQSQICYPLALGDSGYPRRIAFGHL